MELCTSRHLLLSVLILQLISLTTRQVFDFLGFMWASVLFNFLYTLFIIFGIFGVIQCRSKYTLLYTICSCVWLLWNIFVMCLYANIPEFVMDKGVLSLGTGSSSWWQSNGPGCKSIFLANQSTIEDDPLQVLKPDLVAGCVIDYRHVEFVQAAVQAVLALWALFTGLRVTRLFILQDECDVDADDTKKKDGSLSLYSIEYNPRKPDQIEEDSSQSENEESEDRILAANGSRPMTPRRVKRRSVNSRGTLPSTSSSSYQQQPPPYVKRSNYNSMRSNRSSQRKQRPVSIHQSPVTKFLEHQSYRQQVLNDSSTSNDSCQVPYRPSSQLLSPSGLLAHTSRNVGMSNPMFPSNTSLDRPPSARSSYSNYHGVRTLSFPGQAAAQAPGHSRGATSTHSTFFNHGPPAYDIQGSVDSETVI